MYKSLYLKIVAAILFVFIVVTIGYAEWKGMRNNNEIKIQHSPMQSSITEISKTQKIDISGWEIYHNEKYGFEIEYPNSFAVEEDASAQNIVIGGTMYSTQAKDPLTIEVIKPNTLQFSNFIEKVLTSSARIKSFSVH